MFCSHVCMCPVCMPGASRSQKYKVLGNGSRGWLQLPHEYWNWIHSLKEKQMIFWGIYPVPQDFIFIFKYLYMGVLVCRSVHSNAVTVEAGRKCLVPGIWNYRQFSALTCGCQGSNLDPLQEQQVLLTAVQYLQPLIRLFLFMFLFVFKACL